MGTKLIVIKNAFVRKDTVTGCVKGRQPATYQSPEIPYLQINSENTPNAIFIECASDEECDALFDLLFQEINAME